MLFGKNKPQDNPPPAVAGKMIFDVSTPDFEARVINASMETPVVVEFWAPWCGPCKQLMPILEKTISATNGAVLMAKVNIDDNQQLAAALRIQSVPTVFAFFEGKPIDAFQGALPESQVKAFIEKLVQLGRDNAPDAIDIPEALKGAATAIAEGDHGTAQAIYAHILEQDPKNIQAFIGVVRLLIAAGQIKEAEALIASAPAEISSNPNFTEARTALELASAAPSGETVKLAAAVEKNPADHQARFDLATAQFTGGQKQEAIENLLEIVRRNRGWNEEAARKQLVRFFEAMGHADPLTVESRKKLSSILFS